jgi:hypothetical protein
MIRVMVVLAAGLVVGGCANTASQVTAAYVSPYLYENLTCPQLADEASRLSARAAVAAGVQDQKATGDAIATGVALVLFWPAAFLVKGDGPQAAELARLKGEMEAVEQVATRKRCGFQFRAPVPG